MFYYHKINTSRNLRLEVSKTELSSREPYPISILSPKPLVTNGQPLNDQNISSEPFA